MAPLQDFITENESARICGVSVNTLNRFIETGYLQVEHDGDGLRLFSKNELKRVFGISDEIIDSNRNSSAINSFSGNAAPKFDPDIIIEDEVTETRVEKVTEETKESFTSATAIASPIEPKMPIREPLPREFNTNLRWEPPVSETIQSQSQPQAKQTTKPYLRVLNPHVENSELPPLEPRPQRAESTPTRAPAYDLLDAEVSKLKNIVTLLEKILELREAEIESLKKQNSWLQERVERMEERSDREQLLLLAESETVRKLVIQQRRSPVRAALEWLGLAEQSNFKSTIDLGGSK